jgi:hypothetical protein
VKLVDHKRLLYATRICPIVTTVTIPDKQIGQNLIRLRGGRSQQDVADEMRELGWRWSQATVWSVEKGERPLRLSEAGDLASVLHVEPMDFMQTEDFTSVEDAVHGVTRMGAVLTSAVDGYMDHWSTLLSAVERHGVLPKDLTDVIERLRLTPELLASMAQEDRPVDWIHELIEKAREAIRREHSETPEW